MLPAWSLLTVHPVSNVPPGVCRQLLCGPQVSAARCGEVGCSGQTMHDPADEKQTSRTRDGKPTSACGGTLAVSCAGPSASFPFSRCTYCALPSARRCPTLKVGVALAGIWAATGLVALRMGGPAGQAVFIEAGLIVGLLLVLTNVHSNRVHDRHRLLLHEELAKQHQFLQNLAPLGNLQECLEYIVDHVAIACAAGGCRSCCRTRRWSGCGLPRPGACRKRWSPSRRSPSARASAGRSSSRASRCTCAMPGRDRRPPCPIEASAFMSAPLLCRACAGETSAWAC